MSFWTAAGYILFGALIWVAFAGSYWAVIAFIEYRRAKRWRRGR